ncbi:hypothetical protein PMIN06_012318 [Paraphaeosphaeria minitans]
MLPYLLQAFIDELEDPDGRMVEGTAPWSWSTTDAALAAALEPLFSQHGFPEELLNVTVCTDDERVIANECWNKLLGRLVESVSGNRGSKRNEPLFKQMVPLSNSATKRSAPVARRVATIRHLP